MTKLPSKGPNSPFSVGTRILIARTCIRCGELADADSFPVISGVGARRRVCHKCFNAQKKRDREERGIGIPQSRPPEKFQTKRRTQWSLEDDNYLREHLPNQGYEEIAMTLGRSLKSVYARRSILGLAIVRKKHRVEKPWVVKVGDEALSQELQGI